MLEHVLVLFGELLGAQVAVFVEKVDFEYLPAVGGVGVSANVGNQEGEHVAQSAEPQIGGESVVVVRVEELSQPTTTSSVDMPAV